MEIQQKHKSDEHKDFLFYRYSNSVAHIQHVYNTYTTRIQHWWPISQGVSSNFPRQVIATASGHFIAFCVHHRPTGTEWLHLAQWCKVLVWDRYEVQPHSPVYTTLMRYNVIKHSIHLSITIYVLPDGASHYTKTKLNGYSIHECHV